MRPVAPDPPTPPAAPGAAATPAETAARLARLPSLRLLALWLGLAHLSLLLAALVLAAEPALLARAFYHPRLLAAVHLVALGWVSGSILGSLHLIPLMALGVRVAPSRGDAWAFASYAAGTAGVVAHFWLGRQAGVAWSALPVLAAAAWVGWRVLPAVLRARAPGALRVCFTTAFAGFGAAVVLGMLVASGRRAFGGTFFAGTFAHAHLALLGWVFPVVLGAGYRLLPMLIPSAMPAGPLVAASLAGSAGGAAAVAAGLLLASRHLLLAGGIAAAAGVLAFLANVGWMLRNRRPAPPARPRPDLPLGHVTAALVALAAALACGIALLGAWPAADPGLRAAYGVLGLLGFFGQLVAGVGQRLVAWLAWLHAYTGSGFRSLPPTPYALLSRRGQGVLLACWVAGVGLLAAGAGVAQRPLVRAGALALGAAALTGAVLLLTAVHRAREPARP
jgi:nitrite reductase (NO-forming)